MFGAAIVANKIFESALTPGSALWHIMAHTAALSVRTIRRSSGVERAAVNRLVVGSNPTAGVRKDKKTRGKCLGFFCVFCTSRGDVGACILWLLAETFQVCRILVRRTR